MSESQVKCREQVSDRNPVWPRYHQCSRWGKVERHGKWYCNQHDPVKVQERIEKLDKKWKEENAASAARRNAPGLRIKELEEQRDAALFELENVVAWCTAPADTFCQWCEHIWNECQEHGTHNGDCIVPRLEKFLKVSKGY